MFNSKLLDYQRVQPWCISVAQRKCLRYTLADSVWIRRELQGFLFFCLVNVYGDISQLDGGAPLWGWGNVANRKKQNMEFMKLSTSHAVQFWRSTTVITSTLWLFNIAMANGPFIVDFPIKTSIYGWFSMAMLNNQMVSTSSSHQKWDDVVDYSAALWGIVL